MFDPLLAMVRLMGEVRVDLAVWIHLFPSLSFRLHMADRSWMGDEPQQAIFFLRRMERRKPPSLYWEERRLGGGTSEHF